MQSSNRIAESAATCFPDLFPSESQVSCLAWPTSHPTTPAPSAYVMPPLDHPEALTSGGGLTLPTGLDPLLFVYNYITSGSRFEPCWLTGPTGSGKSSLVRYLAAAVRSPLYEVTGHDRLESMDLIGQWVSRGPLGMEYVHGPLARAYRDGGIFLFNEADLCSPATLTGLNTVLDGAPLIIPENGGEVIQCHPDFILIITSNGNGQDETGLYAGVRQMNLAFSDRFACFNVGYLSADAETTLLKQHAPKMSADDISFIVKLAGKVRESFMSNSDPLPITMSTRTCLRICDLVQFTDRIWQAQPDGLKAAYFSSPLRWQWALDIALLNKADATARAAVLEFVRQLLPVANQEQQATSDELLN